MINIFIGIDSGSRTTKLVVLKNKKIIASRQTNTGVNPVKTAKILLNAVKNNLRLPKIKKIFSTGYGRNIIPFAQKAISEISCHAKGINYLFPEAHSIIDIGGQDSKAIVINNQGKVLDFIMNDRCAAGTGRFLEVAANILDLTVDKLGALSLKSQNDININSTCVVFAESEIISLLSQGQNPADIINSVHNSIARRTKNLIAQLSWKSPVIFTGGVAKNIGMHKSLEKVLNTGLAIPKNPFITGALGAALLASEKIK